jgi:hypothetical protein
MVRNYYEDLPPVTTYYNPEDRVGDRSTAGGCGAYQGGYDGRVYVGSGPNYYCYVHTGPRKSCAWYEFGLCNTDPDWTYTVTRKPTTTPAGEKVAPKPGNSYTPNSDNDNSCNAGLDARINNLLPNLLNDPAVSQANDACANAAVAANPDATRECDKFKALLDARRQERDGLASDRNGLRQPLNSCNCTAGPGSNCRNTSNTYTCP